MNSVTFTEGFCFLQFRMIDKMYVKMIETVEAKYTN